MADTLTKIYVHLVFHTKKGKPVIQEIDLPEMFAYIGGLIKSADSIPLEVGGIRDHIHALFVLPKTMTLADFARHIKANSSKWIKSKGDYYKNFAWQDGYGAFSVSASVIDKTREYIRNQAQHHEIVSYQTEYKNFLSAYHISYNEKYIFEDI
ncbi:MAG: transposase [Bacteroidales bacterium]|jgi:REP element-mobilizing transposase RayT|nr:transposase [Bacteroidales bacterium]